MTYWVQRNSTKKMLIGIVVLIVILAVSIPITVFALNDDGETTLSRVGPGPLSGAGTVTEPSEVEVVLEPLVEPAPSEVLGESGGINGADLSSLFEVSDQLTDLPEHQVGEEVPTAISISPPYGAVGTEVDVTITISSPFKYSYMKDVRVEAIKDGSIRFLPDTFNPIPSIPVSESGDVDFLVWEGLSVAPEAEIRITGKARISGPRSFTIFANSQGKREITVAGTGEYGGVGSGRGITSSLRDTRDSLIVGDLFDYVVEIEGQADAAETFEFTLYLPEEVFAEGVHVDMSGVLSAGSCSIGAESQSIVCTESRIERGGTMTVTASVRADRPGADSVSNSVKATLVVTYPETGIQVASEEVTFIYQ